MSITYEPGAEWIAKTFVDQVAVVNITKDIDNTDSVNKAERENGAILFCISEPVY
jgi:hypothetical protein